MKLKVVLHHWEKCKKYCQKNQKGHPADHVRLVWMYILIMLFGGWTFFISLLSNQFEHPDIHKYCIFIWIDLVDSHQGIPSIFWQIIYNLEVLLRNFLDRCIVLTLSRICLYPRIHTHTHTYYNHHTVWDYII